MRTRQEGCQPLLSIHHPHRLDKTRLWVTSSSPSQEDQEEEEEPEIPEWPQEQEVEEQSTLSSPVEQEWEVKENQYIPPEESQPESPQNTSHEELQRIVATVAAQATCRQKNEQDKKSSSEDFKIPNPRQQVTGSYLYSINYFLSY